MILKFKHLLFLVLIASLSATCFANNKGIELLTKTTQFKAGETVVLKFSNTTGEIPNLYISNSYGSTIITPDVTSQILSYRIPQSISKKTGVIRWKILMKNSISGTISILPKQETASLETYLGPPSIEAGGTDYAMLTVIPTDIHDNPLADNTKVTVKYQFLENEVKNDILIKNRIAYKNIFSPNKTGRILVSSECLNFNSKEYTINVMPAIPTDFLISHQRNHNYADGNQITTFLTSIIKDSLGNIVSDGTYVEYFITNKSKHILKTSGTTINGIAKAKMIHPDHEDQWLVKAFIEGIAESNTIKLAYKPIISDFEILFSKNNRTITIGPLKSFMNQMVPDGLEVTLYAFENETKLQTIRKSTFEGFVTFKLDTNNFPSKHYTFKIKTAGIEKTCTNIKL